MLEVLGLLKNLHLITQLCLERECYYDKKNSIFSLLFLSVKIKSSSNVSVDVIAFKSDSGVGRSNLTPGP